MGMFDDVIMEYPLPDGNTATEFQTKSLECLMEHYRITVEGRLLLMQFNYETIPEAEREYPFEIIRSTEAGEVDINYHGIIEIHDGEHSYAVAFTHGTVEWVKPYARYGNRRHHAPSDD